MDEIEKALSIVLKKEAERFEDPIICFINNKPCNKCQPFCTHRQKEEHKRSTPEVVTWEDGSID